MGKKKRNANSPFWDHDAQAVIEGKYNGFQKTDMGFALIIGEKLVGFSSGIRRALLDKVEDFTEGKTKLRFEFLGQKKTKSGNRFNDIAVSLNGKLIDTSNFPTMDAKQMLLEMKKEEDAPPKAKKRGKKH
jgi:hypothetical protein